MAKLKVAALSLLLVASYVMFQIPEAQATATPVTLGNYLFKEATYSSPQRQIHYAQGRYWAFFSDTANSNHMSYSTSVTGLSGNWSSSIVVYDQCHDSGDIDFTVNGTHVFWAYISGSVGSQMKFRQGTLNTDGTITWNADVQAVWTKTNYPRIAVDSTGHVFITYLHSQLGDDQPRVIKNDNTDGTWSTAANFPHNLTESLGPYDPGTITALSNGKMYATYTRYTSPNEPVRGSLYNGTGWEDTQNITTANCDYWQSSTVYDGSNTLYYALYITGTVRVILYNETTKQWSAETVVAERSPGYLTSPTISYDPDTGYVYIFCANRIWDSIYHAYDIHCYYYDTVSWSSVLTLYTDTDEIYYYSIASVQNITDGKLAVMYTSKANDIKVFILGDPTIGSFTADSTVYGNTFFYLNATINKLALRAITDFNYVTVEISENIILKWEQATDTFSETQDTNSYCTLDSVSSHKTVLNSTAYRLSWYIALQESFPEGSVDIVASNTVVYDDFNNYASNSQTALFSFEEELRGPPLLPSEETPQPHPYLDVPEITIPPQYIGLGIIALLGIFGVIVIANIGKQAITVPARHPSRKPKRKRGRKR